MGNIIIRDLKEAYGLAKRRMVNKSGARGFARRMGYNVPLLSAKKKIRKKKRVRTKVVYIYK